MIHPDLYGSALICGEAGGRIDRQKRRQKQMVPSNSCLLMNAKMFSLRNAQSG
jgi:hypothetical protein